MAVYDSKSLDSLVSKLKDKDDAINKASALAVNKTATYVRGEAIDALNADVTLDKGYISKHIKVVARASSRNLRAIIRANARGTHLSRFSHRVSKKGVAVKINRDGGYKMLEKAFVVTNLRGSASKGIAMKNREAVKHFARASSGDSSPNMRRKLYKQRRKAQDKPNGITVLHSRSINQMFVSQREMLRPRVETFMRSEFLKDFKRLSK